MRGVSCITRFGDHFPGIVDSPNLQPRSNDRSVEVGADFRGGHPGNGVILMNASIVELAVESAPLVLLGIAVYRMLLGAGFHNTKYQREGEHH